MHEIETHFKSAQPGLSQPGQALKMKGLEIIKSFLQGGEPLTEDSLPSRGPRVVDREALIHTIMSFHKALRAASLDGHAVQELVALKKANPTTTSTSPDGETAPESGVSTAPAGTEKKEEERLCASMWGKKACPGLPECKRKHLTLCNKGSCYGNPENRRACAESDGMWHGHIQAAIRAQKKHERQQALQKKDEAERKEYLSDLPTYRAWKAQGNGQNPSTTGRGQKPRQSPGGQPLQGQQRAKRGPTTIKLGDFVPKQNQQGFQGGKSQPDQQRVKRGPKHPQAPTYAQAAAGAVIPVTQASAPMLTQVMAVPDVKSQIISQLQSLTVLMQQVL